MDSRQLLISFSFISIYFACFVILGRCEKNTGNVVVPVINKICKIGKVFVHSEIAPPRCVHVSKGLNWTGFFYDSKTFQKLDPEKVDIRPKYNLMADVNPKCPDGWMALFNFNTREPNDTSNHFILTDTGQLMWRGSCSCGKCKDWAPLLIEYFADGLGSLVNPENENSTAIWTGQEQDQVVYICKTSTDQAAADKDNRQYEKDKKFAVVLFITSTIYFMTVGIYLAVWSSLALPARIIFSAIFSRAIWSLLLGLVFIGSLLRWDRDSKIGCQVIAITTHYFTIASYSWVAVLTFNLWWTFRSIRPPLNSDTTNKLYFQISLFGWGAPLVLLLISVTVNYTLKNPEDHPTLVPDYGNGICFVVDCAYAIYVHTFTALFLWPALIFSLLTFYTLYKFKRDTARARDAKHGEKQSSFKLYVKLLWLMSINWVIGHAIWYFQEEHDGFHDVSWTAAILTWLHWGIDLIGSSVFIFVVFGCSHTNVAKLEQNYESIRVLLENIRKFKASGLETSSNAYGTFFSKSTASTN